MVRKDKVIDLVLLFCSLLLFMITNFLAILELFFGSVGYYCLFALFTIIFGILFHRFSYRMGYKEGLEHGD